MRFLLTGGAGFVGHHIVERILAETDHEIVSIDRLGVSGNYNRLADLKVWREAGCRVRLTHHDLRSPINDGVAADIGQVDCILHVAASSHVDRSIADPIGFVLDNVVATANVLEFARAQRSLKAFLYFSTDEVFGPAPAGVKYKEWDRYNSGNPYSATKAGAEELCLAYGNTYGLPVIVSHTMNVIGERQHPEKFVPKVIRRVRSGEPVEIHAHADLKTPGSRMWIPAVNVASAVLFLVDQFLQGKLKSCDKFNIVGEREIDNLTMAQLIAGVIGRPLNYRLVDFHSSRPGHDPRYALDGAKLAGLGWNPPADLDAYLRQIVEWTMANPRWLNGAA